MKALATSVTFKAGRYSPSGTLAVSNMSTISPSLDKGNAMASHGLGPTWNQKAVPVAATGRRVLTAIDQSRTVGPASLGISTS